MIAVHCRTHPCSGASHSRLGSSSCSIIADGSRCSLRRRRHPNLHHQTVDFEAGSTMLFTSSNASAFLCKREVIHVFLTAWKSPLDQSPCSRLYLPFVELSLHGYWGLRLCASYPAHLMRLLCRSSPSCSCDKCAGKTQSAHATQPRRARRASKEAAYLERIHP